MKNHIPHKTLKEFGFLIGFTFPLLIGWILPLFAGYSFRTWTLFISIPSIILAITKPGLLLEQQLFEWNTLSEDTTQFLSPPFL